MDKDKNFEIKIRDENNPGEIRWQIKEPNLVPRSGEWLWALGIFGIALIIFSIILKNYLFILIVVLAGFIVAFLRGENPETLHFKLDGEGLHIKDRVYHYGKFESFWIFPAHIDFEAGTTTLNEREFALRHKQHFLPILTIPFHGRDEGAIRKILSGHLEESEEKEPLLDLLRKRLF